MLVISPTRLVLWANIFITRHLSSGNYQTDHALLPHSSISTVVTCVSVLASLAARLTTWSWLSRALWRLGLTGWRRLSFEFGGLWLTAWGNWAIWRWWLSLTTLLERCRRLTIWCAEDSVFEQEDSLTLALGLLVLPLSFYWMISFLLDEVTTVLLGVSCWTRFLMAGTGRPAAIEAKASESTIAWEEHFHNHISSSLSFIKSKIGPGIRKHQSSLCTRENPLPLSFLYFLM